VTASVIIVDPARPGPVGLPRELDADVVIMPDQLADARGVYSDRAVPLAKAMRADGLDVRWLHAADSRVWQGERSALLTLVAIPFAVGVASSAAWAGLVRSLGKRTGQVKLKVGYRKSDVSEERWLELEGSFADVAAALEKLDPWLSLSDCDDDRQLSHE